MFRFTILCLFLFFSAILAAPLDSRTAFAPPITSPTAQSVWKVGQVQTVTWQVDLVFQLVSRLIRVQECFRNTSRYNAVSTRCVTGMIQLGYLDPNSEGEHLSTILASGFNLTDEKANITVPSVVTRSTYIIVLFGDSGNISPEFTIEGTSASSGSESSASTNAASTSSGSAGSPGSELSATPSPPITTGSFSLPFSTATAPSSAPTTQSIQSQSQSQSSSLSTSASASASVTSRSPFPSPSTNAGWSTTLNTYQVIMTPALALLLFI
ncbi:hypothetical protein MSAN_01884700 [Mycena sanguinolenta]|uniref:Uncharacterized protein n=1 Tax=Mycena sanguinolenta TaxID=230812 RepID=A0A8H6XUC2_9AGAR|nr:hypothetical protein MSAN_01884700 [Mycena sanguinolenta]